MRSEFYKKSDIKCWNVFFQWHTQKMVAAWNSNTVKQSGANGSSKGCFLNWFTPCGSFQVTPHTWVTNADLSPKVFCGIHFRANSPEVLLTGKMYLEIKLLKLLSPLPGANGLNDQSDWWTSLYYWFHSNCIVLTDMSFDLIASLLKITSSYYEQ